MDKITKLHIEAEKLHDDYVINNFNYISNIIKLLVNSSKALYEDKEIKKLKMSFLVQEEDNYTIFSEPQFFAKISNNKLWYAVDSYRFGYWYEEHQYGKQRLNDSTMIDLEISKKLSSVAAIVEKFNLFSYIMNVAAFNRMPGWKLVKISDKLYVECDLSREHYVNSLSQILNNKPELLHMLLTEKLPEKNLIKNKINKV